MAQDALYEAIPRLYRKCISWHALYQAEFECRLRSKDRLRITLAQVHSPAYSPHLAPKWFSLVPNVDGSFGWQAKEALEGFGDFKIGGQIIHTVKYADDLVLLAKEEKVLQDMIN